MNAFLRPLLRDFLRDGLRDGLRVVPRAFQRLMAGRPGARGLSLRLVLGALALLPALASAQGAVSTTPQTRAELRAYAPDGLKPGARFWAGLQITHAPDWHTYWKNPGDSGLATELAWTLPAGAQAGAIAWPTPRKFPIGPLANYGYDGTVLLPVPVTLPADWRGEALDLALQASWLVCKTECIPEQASLRLSLPAAASPDADTAAAFRAAFAAAPTDQPAAGSRLTPGDKALGVAIDGLPAAWRGQRLEFYPELTGVIEPGAPWTQAWEGARWTAQVPLNAFRSEAPATMDIVLARADAPGQGPGEAGVRLAVPVEGAWPPAAPLPAAGLSPALEAALAADAARVAGTAAPTPAALGVLLLTLLGALAGGLILNLMPCVFPVLAIKVMALTQSATPAQRRGHALAYTAGVVLSFLALGGLLLALRAAGEQLGWGFQLQSPAVVAALAGLFTLIGLNLAGLFELGQLLPSGVASLRARRPAADAFLGGVLATAVASPCTAPFMGAALGLAIGLPAWQALAVFAALGLGMALPYLAAGWVPALARALPRPGAWMLTFRQLMAFPMFATVVWLLWVLGQQSGIDGAAALLMALVALALLVWALGRAGRGRWALSALAGVTLAAVLLTLGPAITRLAPPASATTGPAALAPDATGVVWEAWSPARQAERLAEGRTVFVDFTAAWCVTCQVNKRTTLSDDALLTELRERRVALLRADWTRRDPAITAALAALGRNGVPTYAVHVPGQPPRVLSELIGVEEVRAALADAR